MKLHSIKLAIDTIKREVTNTIFVWDDILRSFKQFYGKLTRAVKHSPMLYFFLLKLGLRASPIVIGETYESIE